MAFEMFRLDGRVAVVTGGCGLLGREHAIALAQAGAHVVLADLGTARPADIARDLSKKHGGQITGCVMDVTRRVSVNQCINEIVSQFTRIDILVNNAARNPKFVADGATAKHFDRGDCARNFCEDLEVGVNGALYCTLACGDVMLRAKRGVILNIASDLALIAPDQRIYRDASQPGCAEFVKPVSYSVAKSGLLGMTRYFATLWADKGIRVNALSPGGVFDEQDSSFVARLSTLIPMGRMANRDEYRGAIMFMCSDASSYMTGTNLVIDGGRTAW